MRQYPDFDAELLKLTQNRIPVDGPILLLDVPSTAENGAIVPISLASSALDFRELSLLAEGNPNPLLAHFSFSGTARPKVSLRVRLNQSGPVTLIAQNLNQYAKVQKGVRVALSGCR